jgi:AraC-like DNA-binding protein
VWRSAASAPKRIVPDGCLDLVVGVGGVFIAGPDTRAWSSVTAPGEVLHGVRFTPGRAAAVLGVAADELRDSRVALRDLWGHEGELLTERLLAGTLTPAAAVASWLPDIPPPDPAVAALIAQLDAGVSRVTDAAAALTRSTAEAPARRSTGRTGAPARLGTERAGVPGQPGAGGPGVPPQPGAGGLGVPPQLGTEGAEVPAQPRREKAGRTATPAQPVTAMPGRAVLLAAAEAIEPEAAGFLAVSERRLRRRFVQAVGYGPATYLRVSRFQRAVALAPYAPGLAALAAAAGYADQAHLSRDVRALTGLTPRVYFAGRSTVDGVRSA